MQSFGKLAGIVAAGLVATAAQAFAANVTIDAIDQVPFANGATVDLATVKAITAAVDVAGTNVKMDLLDPSGKVLVDMFASRNFLTAEPVDLPGAGVKGVTKSLNAAGAKLANGNYIIRAHLTDCSRMKVKDLQCLETTQDFQIVHRRGK